MLTVHSPGERAAKNYGRKIPAMLVAAGFLLRLGNAAYRFLNADEALHYLLSLQPSLAATYRATLTTAHPPLLIVFLHYWGMLGRSELFLRVPFVIAGTLFCWVVFCWLKRVRDEATALFALVLLLFSPALIVLSAEVRQYPLLLLFCACSLYLLDRAIEESSPRFMLAASLFLYLALLTHYSSLIFALTVGVYALIRFVGKASKTLVLTWALAQAVALALIAYMAVHHISKIKSSGLENSILGTYLRRSVLQPGQNPLAFIARSNLRLFHYFFSQAAVGAVALALFLIAIALLFRGGSKVRSTQLPSDRQFAVLLTLPLVVNCILAVLKAYPYGGSRHDAYLSIFALSAVAIALARWNPRLQPAKPALIGVVLAACNLFPTPQGEYIRLKDQSRKLMTDAIASLRALPPESTILTDDQGGLLLSYYLCNNVRVAQIEQPHFELFMRATCGDKSVISLDPDLWIFKAETFPETLRSAQRTYSLTPGTPLWFFQAGWFIDKERSLREELGGYGCSNPQNFGRNMLLCRIAVPR